MPDRLVATKGAFVDAPSRTHAAGSRFPTVNLVINAVGLAEYVLPIKGAGYSDIAVIRKDTIAGIFGHVAEHQATGAGLPGTDGRESAPSSEKVGFFSIPYFESSTHYASCVIRDHRKFANGQNRLALGIPARICDSGY
jgi:hypothetical protein